MEQPLFFASGISSITEKRRLRRCRALPKKGSAGRQVLDAIVDAGPDGMTDDELVSELRMQINTVRSARLDLVDGMWIITANTSRPGHLGQQQLAFRATTKGMLES